MRILRKAFTLIELLVVIAIIAILAAILFPVFAQAKAAAKASVCLSNTKQLGLAMMQYTNDSDGAYPAGWYGGWNYTQPASVPGGTYKWEDAIYPYVKSEGIYSDPANNLGLAGTYVSRDRLTGNTPGNWDDGSYKDFRFGSYGMNCTYWGHDDDVSAPSSDNNNPVAISTETSVEDSAGTLLAADGNGSFQIAWNHSDEQPTKVIGTGNDQYIGNRDMTLYPNLAREGAVMLRHNGRANAIFTDGHSKSTSGGDMLKKANRVDSTGRFPLAMFTGRQD